MVSYIDCPFCGWSIETRGRGLVKCESCGAKQARVSFKHKGQVKKSISWQLGLGLFKRLQARAKRQGSIST